ncbi:alpha/beta fold hydrolase [Clostridium omnivorum]|uniref:prolyl aminopeptidase n=1 Tax=Clostridium omnivorum TaxID=1604902 RepID=A0ABQ5NBH3_9CLOT|nr:alpha/beta hydrolase [Clostridium sp. E14]GLC32624.1 alpha/beta hydrolase [Clostridium sp. E14]
MRNRQNREIFIEEYVSINGIDQYLFHSGTNYDNPVMLFLHGGPGFAESLFAHAFQEKWEEIFTVVHWDQRGAGKTLTRNPNIYPTIDSMLEDLYDTVQYLKKKYNKQKVIILGHSWGSVLGTIFTKKYPEEVAYYIGVGQVISLIDNERVGYEKVKELAIKANDKKTLKRLEAIGNYPGEKFDSSFMTKCSKVRRIQGKYNLAITMTLPLIKNIFKSPIFKLSDISALSKAAKANKKVLEFLYYFNLNAESTEYMVPIYYILGENDWQTPYVIAQNYFNKINAPSKGLYLIPNAGHGTMVDQPQLFFEALLDVNNKESKNS